MFDCALLVAIGVSPFSLSGSFCTFFFWKFRGNATSALPYKFIFVLYILAGLTLIDKWNKSETEGDIDEARDAMRTRVRDMG